MPQERQQQAAPQRRVAGGTTPQPCCSLPPMPHVLQELQALYEWVDSVPLSRPKKNIARDFADGGE